MADKKTNKSPPLAAARRGVKYYVQGETESEGRVLLAETARSDEAEDEDLLFRVEIPTSRRGG